MQLPANAENFTLQPQEGETPIFFAASKAGRTEELELLEKQTDDAADTLDAKTAPDDSVETKTTTGELAQPETDGKTEEGDSSPSQDGKEEKVLAESPEELAWRAKEDILDLLTSHGADPNISNKEVLLLLVVNAR